MSKIYFGQNLTQIENASKNPEEDIFYFTKNKEVEYDTVEECDFMILQKLGQFETIMKDYNINSFEDLVNTLELFKEMKQHSVVYEGYESIMMDISKNQNRQLYNKLKKVLE